MTPLLHPDYSDYPPNWIGFSLEIRAGRALHRCECSGECGNHKGNRCVEVNKQGGRWMRGRVVLSVAHLCDCYPLCAEKSHVKAMCQGCHLRTDRFRHASGRLRTQNAEGYRSRLYKHLSKQTGFENLKFLPRTPKHKRNRFWFPS